MWHTFIRRKEESFVLFHTVDVIRLQIHYRAMEALSLCLSFSMTLRVFAAVLEGHWADQISYSENTT